MADAADVVTLAPLDRALGDLVSAETRDDKDAWRAAVTAVALAWGKLDDRERATILHYNPEGRMRGASLRTALAVPSRDHDLGACASNYAEAKGRPWTT